MTASQYNAWHNKSRLTELAPQKQPDSPQHIKYNTLLPATKGAARRQHPEGHTTAPQLLKTEILTINQANPKMQANMFKASKAPTNN